MNELDRRFMAAAIRLGATANGTTAPNPAAVGAILVKDGVVVGRGRTGAGGRPHAEAVALDMAGQAARDATAYVSLEPCAHQGSRGGPCTDKIIAAGLSRVVAAMTDPDPRTAGDGFERLREAGMVVCADVSAADVRRALAGHVLSKERGRPYVMLKLAVSADDAIGREGEAQVAVTGAIARRHVQAMRSRFDAILVGRGTVEADDPALTCRLPGLEHRSPVRVVLDSDGKLAADHKVFGGDAPTWVAQAAEGDAEHQITSPLRGGRDLQAEGAVNLGRGASAESGVLPPPEIRAHHAPRDASNFDLPSRGRLGSPSPSVGGYPTRSLTVPRGAGALDLAATLNRLAEEGITRLLVEGGARVARSFLEADLVDVIMLFRSPNALGGRLVPALAGLPLSAIEASERFRRLERRRFGADMMSFYERTG